MRPAIIYLLGIFIILGAAAFAEDYYPEVADYRIDARFFPDEAMIVAKANIKFRETTDYSQIATGYIHGELLVDSIVSGGENISFDQDRVPYLFNYSRVATKITFPLNKIDRQNGVTIYYQGNMHASKAESPSNYMRIDADGVFLRSYGYSLWFPVFLPDRQGDIHTNFSKIIIRTPADFYTVVVGEKTAERFESGLRVTEWTGMDEGVFAAQCVSQRCLNTNEGNVVLYHYADSASVEMASYILKYAAVILNKYAQYYKKGNDDTDHYIVEMPRYGDISSGNMTGLQKITWCSFTDQTWAQRGLSHELVHPFVWVRPDVSDRFFCLAVEGFPSYFHLPVMGEMLGNDFYTNFMKSTEATYIKKRSTGKDRRGRSLPKEKPILAITADELSEYKDAFILSDRVLLFFNYLYDGMGRDKFFVFTHDLFSQADITEQVFRDKIEQYLPGSKVDVRIWLETNDFPDRFRITKP